MKQITLLSNYTLLKLFIITLVHFWGTGIVNNVLYVGLVRMIPTKHTTTRTIAEVNITVQ